MGNSQAHSQKQFLDDWTQLQKTTVNTGMSQIWANKQNRKIQIEEYPLYVTTLEEVKQQKKIHQFRHNHPQVVASLYFLDQSKQQFCASNYQGKIFLQRIPLTLANVGDIPFPDALHLYSQALQGFHVLASQVQEGCFPIAEQHIGINCSSIVKVWMNTLYHKNYPNRNQRIAEQKMVRMILDMIDSNVDYQVTNHLSVPRVSRYIYQNSRAPSQVKFNQAINIFRGYVNRFFGGKIPQRLNCVDQVGGSDYLYKSWNEQTSKYQTMQGYLNQQQNTVGSTRGFSKTHTIPYQTAVNNNSLNESYTQFRREQPIVSSSNLHNNNSLHPNSISYGNAENSYTRTAGPFQRQNQPKPLSVPTSVPIINYSPSGFLTNNNNNFSTLISPRPSNGNINGPLPIIQQMNVIPPENQILIKSNVRSVLQPSNQLQQINPTVRSTISNNNKFVLTSNQPVKQTPIFAYQFNNSKNVDLINSTNIKPNFHISPQQLNFKPQTVNFQQPTKTQFHQSVIQNRIVHHDPDRDTQKNIYFQERVQINNYNNGRALNQHQNTPDLGRIQDIQLFNKNNSQLPQTPIYVSQQHRSIYVPMPPKIVNEANVYVDKKDTPKLQYRQELSKNYESIQERPISQIPSTSKSPIVNQSNNTERVTSQIVVIDKSENTNSYSSNLYSPSSHSPAIRGLKEQKAWGATSPYSQNRLGRQDLASSRYDNLKLDDGMSSAAFLNQLKNLKSTSRAGGNSQFDYKLKNQYKIDYINGSQYNVGYNNSESNSLSEGKQYLPVTSKNYQEQQFSEQGYTYNYEHNSQSQTYENKYGGSFYNNLKNQNQTGGENNQIRYTEYRSTNQPEYEEQQGYYRYESRNQGGLQYSYNQSEQQEYKSYFDKYANYDNLNKSPNKVNQSNLNQIRQGSGQVQQDYKVEYDPQILADLRKLHGQV